MSVLSTRPWWWTYCGGDYTSGLRPLRYILAPSFCIFSPPPHVPPPCVCVCVCAHLCVCAKSLQSCLTLCNPMDHNPPGSSVHGILQARILEWVAMPSFRGSSPPRHLTHVSSVHWQAGFFTASATWEAPAEAVFYETYCVIHSCFLPALSLLWLMYSVCKPWDHSRSNDWNWNA